MFPWRKDQKRSLWRNILPKAVRKKDEYRNQKGRSKLPIQSKKEEEKGKIILIFLLLAFSLYSGSLQIPTFVIPFETSPLSVIIALCLASTIAFVVLKNKNDKELLERLKISIALFVGIYSVTMLFLSRFLIIPVIDSFNPIFFPIILLGLVPVIFILLIRIKSEKFDFLTDQEIDMIDDRSLVYRIKNKFLAISAIGISNFSNEEHSKKQKSRENSFHNEKYFYYQPFLTPILKDNIKSSFEIQVISNRVKVLFYIFSRSKNKEKAIITSYLNSQKILGAISAQFPSKKINNLSGSQIQRIFYQKKLSDLQIEITNDKILKIVEGSNKPVFASIVQIKGKPYMIKPGEFFQIDKIINNALKLNFDVNYIVKFEKQNLKKKSIELTNFYKNKGKHTIKDLIEEEKKELEIRELKDGFRYGSAKTSIYIVIKSQDPDKLNLDSKRLEYVAKNVFCKQFEDISIEPLKGNKLKKGYLNSLLKQGLKDTFSMSTPKLEAFIQIPSQAFPGLTRQNVSNFELPKEELSANPIKIAHAMWENKPIMEVGINPDDLCKHGVIIGHTGFGKTSLVKIILKELDEKAPEIGYIVFDWKGEYNIKKDNVMLLRPGSIDFPVMINMFDPQGSDPEEHSLKIFSTIKEVLASLFSDHDFSAQMERVCRVAVFNTVIDVKLRNEGLNGFYKALKNCGKEYHNLPMIENSIQAIINRFEKFKVGTVGRIFNVSKTNLDFQQILNSKIIVDFSFLLRNGGTKEDVVLIINLFLKYIFDEALKNGLTDSLRHLIIMEEAQYYFPEIYSRRKASETTPGEDIVLIQRSLGEGVICVSTRPNISGNILANSETKIFFKTPLDSSKVAKFLTLDEDQEKELKELEPQQAITVLPGNSFPFKIKIPNLENLETIKLDVLESSEPSFSKEQKFTESQRSVFCFYCPLGNLRDIYCKKSLKKAQELMKNLDEHIDMEKSVIDLGRNEEVVFAKFVDVAGAEHTGFCLFSKFLDKMTQENVIQLSNEEKIYYALRFSEYANRIEKIVESASNFIELNRESQEPRPEG